MTHIYLEGQLFPLPVVEKPVMKDYQFGNSMDDRSKQRQRKNNIKNYNHDRYKRTSVN